MLQKGWGICSPNTDLQFIKEFWFSVQQEIHQETNFNHRHADENILKGRKSFRRALDLFHCWHFALHLISPFCSTDLEGSAATSLYLVSIIILFIPCWCFFITCWCWQHICVKNEFRVRFCSRHRRKYMKVYKVCSLNHLTKRIPKNAVLPPSSTQIKVIYIGGGHCPAFLIHILSTTHTLYRLLYTTFCSAKLPNHLLTHWKCLSAQSLVGFSFPMWGWHSFYQNLHPREVWMCFCPYVPTNPCKLILCCHHIWERNGLLGVLTIPKWALGQCNCTRYQSLHSGSWNGKGSCFTVLKNLKNPFLESF